MEHPYSRPTPIIADPQERGDRDFRRPGDDEKVVRVNDRKPDGFASRPIFRYISVAGTAQSETRDALASFIAGSQRHIDLERDPKNPYDPNAIKVMGEWVDPGGTMHRVRLGWVPAHAAKEIAQKYPRRELAATIERMDRPTASTSAGLRIGIWPDKQD